MSVAQASCGEATWVEGAAEDIATKEGSTPPPEDVAAGEGAATEPDDVWER
jgi:hypothetical protein